ncbi:Asp-tRNA(Asn)/Glu-tRNA(Gln) amidotransferase subunit GatB [Mycoplasma sp. 128]|uniref:Asp-tRNA(Asn)/Glu-tRNA(Gln) amidotransferase subunit GatB n=1 Tax=Mycoplasma sp. 3341 TaxID=3447506 RepID=UPI003F65B807
MEFEAVIGIEIHLELNTKTKMFSYAANDFNLQPNEAVSVIDLAYPGTLPLLNKQAVISAIKLAKALDMQIDNELHFDRKNYFYPDLPKGFQITQQFRPIGRDGKLPIQINNETKYIAIERIHMEEDTAKQLHENGSTFINYNRAGVPLIEIVSRPVMHSAQEAVEYINMIRLIALSLNISDAKMSEGSLRADVNISIRPQGSNSYGTRVEIKNLNSLNNVAKAIEWEIEWQKAKYLANETFEQQTKRFDEQTQTNKTMRSKSGAVDYKYFSEPNIPFVHLSNELISSIKINELPWQRRQRYLDNKLNDVQIGQLIENIEYANFLDAIASNDFKKTTNIFFSDIVSFLNEKNIVLKDLKISTSDLKQLILLLEENKILKNSVKIVLEQKQSSDLSLNEILNINNLYAKDLSSEIDSIIDNVLQQYPDLKTEYTQRPERVNKFVIGQVMKQTKGQADAQKAQEILAKKLS